MWISHCGKPVSVCDGSDSDSWLIECGYITCVGECVHEGCNGHLYNPPPLSLLCPSGSAQVPWIASNILAKLFTTFSVFNSTQSDN